MAEIIPFKCRFAPRRYQYKGHWIEVFIEEDGSYSASIELSRERGIIACSGAPYVEQAEFIAEELINSWD